MKALTYIEIDLNYCSRNYGVSPCTASIPDTGDIKCFNTLRTCQDPANFGSSVVTLRFAVPTDYLPKDITAIPNVLSAELNPAVVSLGENLGQRASLVVTFNDHRHSDAGTGFDKYLADRPYDPFKQGTFWGKFRARQPYLTGRALRLIRGTLGQSLEEMETRHFVIESFDGPSPEGIFTITAQDVLKLADGDRAQAPRPNSGFLLSAIDDNDTAATLSPAGVGNAEYPASGYVAIGGKEICTFTRTADALTLTRAQFGTIAQGHSTNDRIQLVLRYNAQKPSAIIRDLLVNYADVPSGYIDATEWEAEIDNYYARVMTGILAEPTPVAELVSEIIEQAALAVWWDDISQELRLKVIRAVPATADVYDRDKVLAGSFESQEQPDKRISTMLTYFGQRNPLEGLDDPNNYRSSVIAINEDAIDQYGSNKIKVVFSRWIPFGGSTVAQRLNGLLLGRFRDPPRRFRFNLFRYGTTPVLGDGYQLEGHTLQDATGAQERVPIQLTSLGAQDDRFEVEAEEMRFDDTFLSEDDVNDRVIIIDGNANNINLRTLHDTLYPAPTTGDAATVTVTCYIQAGVIVGSSSTASPAFHVGSWPAGWDDDNLFIVNNGRIQGRGGPGGAGGVANTNGSPGGAGGPAFYTREAITLDNNGEIYGGGGGGGGGAGSSFGFSGTAATGGGGGGGRGQLGGAAGVSGGANPGAGTPNIASQPGNPGSNSGPGTGGDGGTRTTLVGGDGGQGGGAGAAGLDGSDTTSRDGGAGGAGGAAVDGHSFVTYQTTGARLGGLIN